MSSRIISGVAEASLHFVVTFSGVTASLLTRPGTPRSASPTYTISSVSIWNFSLMPSYFCVSMGRPTCCAAASSGRE